MSDRPKLYILVGVPASGKSTWVSQQCWDPKNTVIVSTDEYVEAHAKREGKTYSQVFKDYMPTAVKMMTSKVTRARAAGKDIVWDQTSTTVTSRAKKIKMFADYDYEIIAVAFPTPSKAELQQRLASRPGKNIPDSVMNQMINSFSMPTFGEGFDRIIKVYSDEQ